MVVIYSKDICIHRIKRKKRCFFCFRNFSQDENMPNLQTLSESFHKHPSILHGFCLPVPPIESPWLAQDIRSIVRMRWRHAHTNLGAKIDVETSRFTKIPMKLQYLVTKLSYSLPVFLLCLLSNWLQLLDFFHHLSSIFPQARTVPVESSSHTSWTDKIKRRPPTYSHSQLRSFLSALQFVEAPYDLILLWDRIHCPHLSGVGYVSTSTACS